MAEEKMNYGDLRLNKSGSTFSLLKDVFQFVLLSAILGVVIWMAIQGTGTEVQSSGETDVEASVTITDEESQTTVEEQIKIIGKVSYFYGSDGSFEVEDLGKGIHITKDQGNGICYVIPTGTNLTASDLGSALSANKRAEISVQRDTDEEQQEYQAEILPGIIENTGFIPDKAHAECTKGYQWMTTTPIDNKAAREKRGVCNEYRCYLQYLYYNGYYWRAYYRCYYYRSYYCYGK